MEMCISKSPSNMNTSTEIESSPDTNSEKLFTAEKIPEIVHLFKEGDVDKSGGLDIDEFYKVMAKINPDISKEEAQVLHMKIDTNCDRTVDLGELLHYFLQRNEKTVALDYRNILFPNDFTYIHNECLKPVVKIICLLVTDTSDFRGYCSGESMRSYKYFAYITIFSNGLLKMWLNEFKLWQTVRLYERDMIRPAFHHTPIMVVTDAVYIHELGMLAVSTSNREILFYGIDSAYNVTKIRFAILEEEITAMDYYCAGNTGIMACGDAKGYLFVFVSYYIFDNGLFCQSKLQFTPSQHYPTVTISSLLTRTNKEFHSLRFYAFEDMCTEVQYIPSLQSFSMCGKRATSMALIHCIFNQESGTVTPHKQTFKSRGSCCKCVAYSPWSRFFLTGGETGFLYVWLPHKTTSFKHKLKGHNKSLTQIIYNSVEKIFVSISIDQNVRIWGDGEWTCKQSIFPSGMTSIGPITSVYYNIHNNELFIANSDIAKCLGRGTDVFHNTLRSHNRPLCSMLYHSIYKQVISVCQKGKLTVWDTWTGKAVMEFAISDAKVVGPTCISFDEVKRKLITISCDRKVKQWNFNSGELLDAQKVKLPNDVTSILCINDMFISTKGSSKILQLNPKGKLKNVLEHFLLDTICSMDYFDNNLITASSNGNVLTWDLEASEVEGYINTTISPRTHRLKFDLGQLLHQFNLLHESTKRCEKERVLIVKCLRSREAGPKTATLLIVEDVYITAWSTTLHGGMVGKFKAVKRDDSKITCVSVSETETILLTGDSNGVVCLYDIREFGLQTKDNEEYETVNGWKIPLQSTPLLASWQAGLSELVSVACDPAFEKIFTAELEYNVKLWTSTGTFVGIFGKDRWVNMVQRQVVPITKETEKVCLQSKLEHHDEEKEGEEVAEELHLTRMVKTMPFMIDFIDLLTDKNNYSLLDSEVELVDKVIEKVSIVKFLYTKCLEEEYNDILQPVLMRFNIPLELETLVKFAINDEKKKLSTFEALVNSQAFKTQQITNKTLATTESTETMEMSEKRHLLTYFGKNRTKSINLSKIVKSPKLSDEVELQLKAHWPVNLYPIGSTEPLTDVTITKSPVKRMPEKKPTLVKLPPMLTEVQPAQTQPKPYPPKTPASAGPTRHSKSKREGEFEKDSTRKTLQTLNIILPLPECSKKFSSLREQLKLVKHEVLTLEGPSKDIESTNEVQQGFDYSAKQSSTSTVATKELFSPSTTKETPVLSNEQIPEPCFPQPLLRSPWLEKSPDSEVTPPHEEIQQTELSSPLPPKSKVVKFTEPLVKSQFTKTYTSTHRMMPIKSILRNTGTEKQMPVEERDLVQPLQTSTKMQTTKSKSKLPPLINSVSEGFLVQTQHPLESIYKQISDQYSTSGQQMFGGLASQFSPHTSATKKTTVDRADQKQQKQQLVKPSTSERIQIIKSGLRKFQPVTIQPKGQTTSQTTSLPPISKKVSIVQSQQKLHQLMAPAGPTTRQHRGTRGHTHQRETNLQPLSALLKKVQPPHTEQRSHPPMTPAGPTRPAGSSRTHASARGHAHEREANLQPSSTHLKKVQLLQTEQKPHSPMSPASPTMPVGSSIPHRCTRGYTHERETNLRPSHAQLKQVQTPQNEYKPHPPMTPAGPTRPVGSSRTHRCARGHTNERKTNLRPSPEQLKYVQPPQTEQKPHPP
ncbi:hypothetical protein ILYODFUR_021566 [Ilyodon furcidens]|uniref:WD repeat-containing protein on Y chromosome n=1 Tax=Ilyodon furcidens TaxID=33524 RepID=A0ABV0UA68_9TELE